MEGAVLHTIVKSVLIVAAREEGGIDSVQQTYGERLGASGQGIDFRVFDRLLLLHTVKRTLGRHALRGGVHLGFLA
eukprot:SAG31_NODE_24799_length_474_cov_0.536000_1_plen_76_part_00